MTLAKLLQEMIEQVEGVKLPLGVLDITFYRDDLSILSERPVVNATNLPFQVQDARIVMVDDVLFSRQRPAPRWTPYAIWGVRAAFSWRS